MPPLDLLLRCVQDPCLVRRSPVQGAEQTMIIFFRLGRGENHDFLIKINLPFQVPESTVSNLKFK